MKLDIKYRIVRVRSLYYVQSRWRWWPFWGSFKEVFETESRARELVESQLQLRKIGLREVVYET